MGKEKCRSRSGLGMDGLGAVAGPRSSEPSPLYRTFGAHHPCSTFTRPYGRACSLPALRASISGNCTRMHFSMLYRAMNRPAAPKVRHKNDLIGSCLKVGLWAASRRRAAEKEGLAEEYPSPLPNQHDPDCPHSSYRHLPQNPAFQYSEYDPSHVAICSPPDKNRGRCRSRLNFTSRIVIKCRLHLSGNALY
jgi:hypothetical protein